VNINLKVLVVDRKGTQITQQRVVEIEGKQKIEVSPVWLSDSIAEAFEKHEDRSVPYRKLMGWAIELDKTGSVEIKPEDMQLFISVIESSALLPFVKFQAMSLIEVAQNGS
jgi:hypothetical protein